MSGENFAVRYKVSRLVGAVVSILMIIIAIAACTLSGSPKTPPHLSVKSGFDPCRDIPLSTLNSWNANPTPIPAIPVGADARDSTDPDLKSCNYRGQSGSSAQELTMGDNLYIGLTVMSLDTFHRIESSGEPYRESIIDSRKMAIKGPYSDAPTPGRNTICEVYVQMNGGGLLLTSVKSGDACQFLTVVAQKVVPLLPAGS